MLLVTAVNVVSGGGQLKMSGGDTADAAADSDTPSAAAGNGSSETYCFSFLYTKLFLSCLVFVFISWPVLFLFVELLKVETSLLR